MDDKTTQLLISTLLKVSVSKPPRFSCRGPLPFKEWKTLFINYVKEAKLSDSEANSAIISLLDGEALTFCLSISDRETKSYQEVLESLNKIISPLKGFHESRYEFRTKIQSNGESVHVFAEKLICIAKRAYSDYSQKQIEDIVVEKLLSSVKLPNSLNRPALYQQQFSNVKDLVSYIDSWCSAERFCHLSEKGNMISDCALVEECSSSDVAVVSPSSKMQSFPKPANVGIKNEDFYSLQCFHCMKLGHRRESFPDKNNIKCYNCRGLGHISKQSPSQHKENDQKIFRPAITHAKTLFS